jgi:hypothetical protein
MTTAYLTNKAYGYPNRGDARRIAPIALACIHGTSNPNTPIATALQERNYANRVGSNGPSAHVYGDRDGGEVIAIDAAKYAAWSNGALRSPKQHVAGVTEVMALQAAGYNPNETYYREYEYVSRYPELPLTADQRAHLAEQIARDSLTTGLPIGRATVHLHSDLDTVQKPNCPVPAKDAEAWVADIIRSAREWRLMLELEESQRLVSVLTLANQTLAESRDGWQATADGALRQRDEAVAWGKRLQGFGGAILATDKPEWVE